MSNSALTTCRRLSLVCLIVAGNGCASWWNPEKLYRLNRGPAAMNEEAYYSVPAATPRSLEPAGSSVSVAHDPYEPFTSGRESASRPASGR